jgi:DNA-binding response OmpR family regulator
VRVLIVEDEAALVDAVARGLRRRGWAVDVAHDGDEGLGKALVNDYDVVVLDRDLPALHGDDVCRYLNDAARPCRILMLTAAASLDELVAGLGLGADDYLTKPFRFEELVARIRARLRDDEASGEPGVLRHGDLSLDLRTRQAEVDGRAVDLSAREFALAEVFLRHPGHVLSREQLLSRVWGYDFDPGSNVVDVYVRYLRRKLGADLIETVRGMGYRLTRSGQ